MDQRGQNEIDASLADEVLLEEGTGEDDGSVGLELDARQAAEIRQIFLTTLPDYLEPVRQMVEQLSSEEDADAEIRKALTTTLASMAAAAKRVGIHDVQRTLEALREDAVLLGESAEPQEPLRERIRDGLAELGHLASEFSVDSAKARSETIVAAFRQLPGIDRAALQKLVASGLVFVEQLLGAETSEISAVSGLGVAEVEAIVKALRRSRELEQVAAPVEAPEPPLSAEPAPAPSGETPKLELAEFVKGQVEQELALDETRGSVLALRLRIRALRGELAACEARRHEIASALGLAKQGVLARVDQLSRLQSRRAGLESEATAVQSEFARVSARLATLDVERQRVAEEHRQLAREVAILARRVDSVVQSGTGSEHQRANHEQKVGNDDFRKLWTDPTVDRET